MVAWLLYIAENLQFSFSHRLFSILFQTDLYILLLLSFARTPDSWFWVADSLFLPGIPASPHTTPYIRQLIPSFQYFAALASSSSVCFVLKLSLFFLVILEGKTKDLVEVSRSRL